MFFDSLLSISDFFYANGVCKNDDSLQPPRRPAVVGKSREKKFNLFISKHKFNVFIKSYFYTLKFVPIF